MLYFEIHNNKTFVINADSYILSYLDSILKYPTDIAEMGQYNSENALVHGWDGWVRFLHIPENKLPWFPTGLMGYVCQALGRLNFYYRIEDRRIRPEEMLPHFVDISLRDYQKEAALIGVRVGRGVFAMPPRSGKTRLAIELYRRLAIPTIWIAPTNPIVVQTVEAINSFFGEGFASQLIGKSGEKSLRDASIVVCTAATATRLPLEFYQSRQMIIVDEFHHSSAKSYNIIFKHCDHIYYRFGLTGTFFRSNGDDMAMHAHISNVLMSVDSDYLVKRDNLVSTYVVFIPVISAPLKIGTGIFNEAHGKHGIHHHLIRNQMVVSSALSLKKTGRSVLILVGTKKQGRIIRDMLQGYYKDVPITEFKPVQFISSETPRPLLQKILKSFLDKGEVQIVVGTSVLGEGVDLPTTDALVYACGQKAKVTVLQHAYRVGTASKGKNHAILVDFADRHHKKLLEHSEIRGSIYAREKTFKCQVLDNINQFDEWLQQTSL